MAALGSYLVSALSLVVVGVIVYSICEATGHKPVAQLAQLLTIILVIALTYETIARPVQNLSKKANKVGQTIDKLQSIEQNPIWNKIIWFGASQPAPAAPQIKLDPEGK